MKINAIKIFIIIFSILIFSAGSFFVFQKFVSDDSGEKQKEDYPSRETNSKEIESTKSNIEDLLENNKENNGGATGDFSIPEIEKNVKAGLEKIVSEPGNKETGLVLMSVPFVSQAPSGNWEDDRFQNGCEEVSVLMAMAWIGGRLALSVSEAEQEIIAISNYETRAYGNFYDTSADDTAQRILREYFQYDNVEVVHNISANDIKKEILLGNLVIVPVNGQKIKNPFYKYPGPIQHMLIVIGYDFDKNEFITNDPGTRRGEGYRYLAQALEGALQDYPTGIHLPIIETKTAMIVVRKNTTP